MIEHFEPTTHSDPDNPRLAIPPPPIPHRRWMLDGNRLSLCYEKLRPVSRARHSHPEIKIWLFFEGASGAFTSWSSGGESRDVRVTGRQVFGIGANVLHALHWETEASLLEVLLKPSFCATIPADRLAAVLERELLEGVSHDRVLWELASTIRLLCSYPEQPDVRLLEPMMVAIARRVFMCHSERYAPKRGSRLSEDRTQLVIDYMEENLGKEIDVKELAALVTLSPQHFTELFRNRTGKPPIEYLRELRRIEAHKMIFAGELRMGEIADATGFCDEPHLNREFKKFFGYAAKFLRTRGESATGSGKAATGS